MLFVKRILRQFVIPRSTKESTMSYHVDSAFKEALLRIGFRPVAADALMIFHGIDSVANLCCLSSTDIDNLPEPPESMEVVFSFLALKKLKSLREWAVYHTARGTTARLEEFVEPVITKWLLRIDDMSSYDRTLAAATIQSHEGPSDTIKLVSFDNWYDFKNRFIAAMRKVRSRWGARPPLAYLLRDDDEVGDETFRKTFKCIDDDLIQTQGMAGNSFYCLDNECLWHYLHPLVDSSPAAFIRKYAATQNGRGAWKELKEHGEDPIAVNQWASKAYTTIKNAKYPSGPNYTIERHVAKLIEAFSVLEEAKVPVYECYKVTNLLQSLHGPVLKPLRDSLQSCGNFDKCMMHVISFVKTNVRTILEPKKRRLGKSRHSTCKKKRKVVR